MLSRPFIYIGVIAVLLLRVLRERFYALRLLHIRTTVLKFQLLDGKE